MDREAGEAEGMQDPVEGEAPPYLTPDPAGAGGSPALPNLSPYRVSSAPSVLPPPRQVRARSSHVPEPGRGAR